MTQAELHTALEEENGRLRNKNLSIEDRMTAEKERHKMMMVAEKRRADGFIVKRDRAIANISNWKTANGNLENRVKNAEAALAKVLRKQKPVSQEDSIRDTLQKGKDAMKAVNASIHKSYLIIAVENLQWSGRSFFRLKRCPKCKRRPKRGHRSDCEVFAVLEANK